MFLGVKMNADTMKKIKLSAGFALAGFAVSFVAGLFSRRGFFSIMLFALLFAAVFALLGFVIQLLFSSVLAVEPQARSSPAPGTGNLVDIVVKDEELPGEAGAPSFDVGENRQMLRTDDYGGADAQGGVDTISEVSENAAASEGQPADGAESGASDSQDGEASGAATYNPMDELPSFDNLDDLAAGAADDYKGGAGEAGLDRQNGAGGTFPEPKKSRADSEKPLGNADAALMAKAISTVLAKDKE